LEEADRLLDRAQSKLESAQLLFDNGKYDDAISRAYYSMFYAARALLRLKDITPRTHKGVVSQFGSEFVRKGDMEAFYAKAINYARESREDADYGIYFEASQEEAEDILQDAKSFLEKARDIIEKSGK
jgi:uncharacterized protein (UPF0332 family)